VHHCTLFNVLFDMASNAHWTHMIWCLSLELTFQTILPMFCLLLDVFFPTLQIWFILPHPSITSLPHFEGIHLINPLSIHLLQCSHGSECTCMHDVICDVFVSMAKETTLLFMRFEKICTFLPLPHFRHPKVGLKLPSQRMGS
jgi:hypothetical protein